MIQLPRDFLDFLRLLNQYDAEYLLIGGYAVAFHGYVRFTGDLDIFIRLNTENAERVRLALIEFGVEEYILSPDLFLKKGNIVRMGVPPMRLEILNTISGVEFEECYKNRVMEVIDDVEINFIHLNELKRNKAASGRTKDLNDLENLP